MRTDHAFTVRDALDSGMTPAELRSAAWDAPARGVRTAPAAPGGLVDAIRALAADDQFFSHTTAARIHGMPLPRRLEDDPRVHLASPTGAVRMRRPGVVGHRLKSEVVVVDGARVEAPADAFVHLATLLSVDELVAIGDWLVSPQRSQPCSVEELASAIRRYAGARGLVKARRALAQVRVGAESPRETAMRLLVVRAGLPAPVLQHEVRDAFGLFVGRLDLAWPALRLAVEYAGEHHFASAEAMERDVARLRELRRLGWTIIQVTKRDLRDGGRQIVRTIAEAFASCAAR